MLRYLVERTLDGHGGRLKEYTVGSDAFNRGVAFDPRTDPIVRAEASRLRARLDRYYSTDGHADAVVIELPKGSYVPQFRTRIATSLVRQARWQPILWVIAGSAATIAAFATGAWVARPTESTGQRLLSYDVHLQSSGIVGSEVGTDLVCRAMRRAWCTWRPIPRATRAYIRAPSESTARRLRRCLERKERGDRFFRPTATGLGSGRAVS